MDDVSSKETSNVNVTSFCIVSFFLNWIAVQVFDLNTFKRWREKCTVYTYYILEHHFNSKLNV